MACRDSLTVFFAHKKSPHKVTNLEEEQDEVDGEGKCQSNQLELVEVPRTHTLYKKKQDRHHH